MSKKMFLVMTVLLAGIALSADNINYYTLRQLSGYTFIKIDRVERVWKSSDLGQERIYVLSESGKFLVSDYQLDPLITPGLTEVAIFAKKKVTDPSVQMMILQNKILPPYAEIALVIENQIYKTFWKGELFVTAPAAPAKPVKPVKRGRIR